MKVQILLATLALVGWPLTAFAEGAAPQQGSSWMEMIPIVLIIVIFYFFLIRPQQKRLKEHGNMISSLKKGDKVVTAGGIIATVADVEENILKVEIADGVRVKVERDTIVKLAA